MFAFLDPLYMTGRFLTLCGTNAWGENSAYAANNECVFQVKQDLPRLDKELIAKSSVCKLEALPLDNESWSEQCKPLAYEAPYKSAYRHHRPYAGDVSCRCRRHH